MEEKSRHNFQDSIFRLLFADKDSAIELYNALSGADYDESVAFEFTTLDNAVYAGQKNDLGFKIAGKYVVLTEHQSTINLNMAVRHLQYLGRTYETEVESELLYKRRRVQIPTPEFYVLYTGEERWDIEYLKLSDSFMGEPPLNSAELVVKVIDVRYNKDAYNEVLERSEKLRGYSILVDYVRTYRKEVKDNHIAIKLAINRCMEEGILKNFLTKHSSEVGSMLFSNITMEEFAEIRATEKAEELAKERAEELAEELAKERAEELAKELAKEMAEEMAEERVDSLVYKFIAFCRRADFSEADIKQALMNDYGFEEKIAEGYLRCDKN